MKHLAALTFLLACSIVAWPAAAPPSIRRLDGSAISIAEAASFARKTLEAAQVTGAQIAVLDRGQLVWSEAFGLRRRDPDLPMTRETTTWAASITKGVFATYAMQLVERRELALDTPLAAQLPRPLDHAAGNHSGKHGHAVGVGRLHTRLHRTEPQAMKRARPVSRPFPFLGACYSEQLAATILPDSTLNAGAAADGSWASGVLVGSIVPVSSSFLPTCSLSAVGLAIRRYVCAAAPESAGDAEAPVNTNLASAPAGAAAVVPEVPAVPVAAEPAVPAVPVGFGVAALAVSLGIGGAAFKQPVTTTFLSELDGVLC